MTVSIETTRLSSVITGCGGKLTTCSRRSIRERTRSTKGGITLRPAVRVSLYLPNRSTMPARACGTMRTVLLSTRTTNSKNRMRGTNRYGLTSVSWVGGPSLVERGVRGMDVDGGALDGQHLDGLACLDG